MISLKKAIGDAKIKSIHRTIGLEDIIVKNKEIDDSEIDGDKVMMNLDKGEYFMMNSVGSRIWDIIDSPISVSEIMATLIGEYEVEEETCKASVVEFLVRLNNAELISIK
ncbi:MAG: lasso peptide biosynthesis PqqD family chaperone [Clostridium sp.]